VTGSTLGLRPRPAPPPEVLAAVAAAVEALTTAVPAPAVEPPSSAWRFGGRWWARPVPTRRERPWARR
jgi:hypothetical protein